MDLCWIANIFTDNSLIRKITRKSLFDGTMSRGGNFRNSSLTPLKKEKKTQKKFRLDKKMRENKKDYSINSAKR